MEDSAWNNRLDSWFRLKERLPCVFNPKTFWEKIYQKRRWKTGRALPPSQHSPTLDALLKLKDFEGFQLQILADDTLLTASISWLECWVKNRNETLAPKPQVRGSLFLIDGQPSQRLLLYWRREDDTATQTSFQLKYNAWVMSILTRRCLFVDLWEGSSDQVSHSSD